MSFVKNDEIEVQKIFAPHFTEILEPLTSNEIVTIGLYVNGAENVPKDEAGFVELIVLSEDLGQEKRSDYHRLLQLAEKGRFYFAKQTGVLKFQNALDHRQLSFNVNIYSAFPVSFMQDKGFLGLTCDKKNDALWKSYKLREWGDDEDRELKSLIPITKNMGDKFTTDSLESKVYLASVARSPQQRAVAETEVTNALKVAHLALKARDHKYAFQFRRLQLSHVSMDPTPVDLQQSESTKSQNTALRFLEILDPLTPPECQQITDEFAGKLKVPKVSKLIISKDYLQETRDKLQNLIKLATKGQVYLARQNQVLQNTELWRRFNFNKWSEEKERELKTLVPSMENIKDELIDWDRYVDYLEQQQNYAKTASNSQEKLQYENEIEAALYLRPLLLSGREHYYALKAKSLALEAQKESRLATKRSGTKPSSSYGKLHNI